MVDKSWNQLENDCPIDIKRVIVYAKEFESLIPEKITKENLDKSKENIFGAKGCFDSMVSSLIQMLYDREILKTSEDRILFSWLVDNFGRYLKRLDDEQFNLIIKHDTIEENIVGISRVSSFSNFLRTSVDTLIYETLLKSTKEYNNLIDSEEIKKEPRTFLYILFQVLQVTLSIMGGLTREKTGFTKKGIVQNIPTSWQSLMTPKGQNLIKEGHKEETGMDINEFNFDIDLNQDEEDDIEDT